MRTFKRQQGLATILLVLLISISVMLITATVAKTLMSKKEASVAAHAQTNAQLMSWAGVSAFREFLLQKGQANLSQLTQLNGQNITLKDDVSFKEIVANNIQVSGCVNKDTPCLVTAEINAKNKTSQASSRIEAVYELKIVDGTVTIAGETNSINFTGTTVLSGTTLESEIPNSKVVLNVDGRTEILAGFRTKNISELLINSTGDVVIDCSLTKCGNTLINVNAKGSVHITNPGNFGSIYSKDWVKLQTNVTANEIYAVDSVHLALFSSANTIHSGKDVFISENSSADLIHAKGNVVLTTAARANQIYAQGYINLFLDSEVKNNIESAEHINISASRVRGDAKAYHYVDLDTGSTVYGSVYAKGIKGIPVTQTVVRLSTSKVQGNIYAGGRVSLLDGLLGKDVLGNVYLTGASIVYPEGVKGTVYKNVNPLNELNFTVPNIVESAAIRQHIDDNTDFRTRIDVKEYKNQANYIFTKDTKVARVYLNHLRNEKSQITYMYDNGKQYQVDKNNNKTLINNKGFYLGKYTENNKEYVGAICESIDNEKFDIKSGHCTSEIIGYLPRVSVEAKIDILGLFGIPEDYHHIYGRLTEEVGLPSNHIWYVRSISAPSSIDNATLAPGIMYFEGDVSMAGEANWKADASSNVFTNTFLAEGVIEAIALSPRIYSPYNVLREANADIICHRQLKTKTGARPSVTEPKTISDYYLTPVNLCKNDNEFRYDMNRNVDGTKQQVKIDGVQVDKLDLGYVALMSNKIIRIGACAQIYGDVLAKSNVETTKACGLNAQPNQIVGSISTQGTAPYIEGIKQLNVFAAGSKIVVPNPDFTNNKNVDGSQLNSGLVLASSTLKWAKYR